MGRQSRRKPQRDRIGDAADLVRRTLAAVDPPRRPPSPAPPADEYPGDHVLGRVAVAPVPAFVPGDAYEGPPPPRPSAWKPPPAGSRVSNFRTDPPPPGSRARPVRHGLHPAAVASSLFGLTGGWPRRVGPALFVPTPEFKPRWLASPDALFAFVAGSLAGDGSPVEWATGPELTTKAEFFEFLRQQATPYDAVELAPHEPPVDGVHYLHPPLAGGDGAAFARLLAMFSPATDTDADLIRAFFLTLAWGGPPGQRPAFLFTSLADDPHGGRGVGKTTVAKVASDLFGGHVSLDPGDDIARIKTRLLTPDSLARRIALLDNLKTHKFSWGEMEALLTDSVVSGHQLYAGDAQRPNRLVFCLTVNGASLSRDIAQRVVIVTLRRPAYSPTWEDDARQFVTANRAAILGDIVAALRDPAKPLGPPDRWGAWQRGVLARVGDPVACQTVTATRRAEADADDDEAGRVRGVFEDVLRSNHRDPETGGFAFDSPAVVEIVGRAKSERQTATSASGYLKTVAVPELRKSVIDGRKFWCWIGPGACVQRFERVRYEPDAKAWRFEGDLM